MLQECGRVGEGLGHLLQSLWALEIPQGEQSPEPGLEGLRGIVEDVACQGARGWGGGHGEEGDTRAAVGDYFDGRKKFFA